MIKAEFQKKYFWNIVCLFCGLFLVALFIFIGHKDSEATLGNILCGVAFGLFICFFSIISLLFNFGAYLCIEDGRIKGKYHYFGKIDCHISDVTFAAAGYNTVIIQLKGGKCHTIMGIENSWEIGAALRRNLYFNATEQPEKLMEDLKCVKSARKKGITCVCSGMAFIFINIFIAVLLTGARELHEFSKVDWTIMTFMGVIEIVTVIATFYFANKTGKHNVPIEKLKYSIQRTIIETNLVLPGNVIKVYTDENYSGRITVCGYPNDTSVYYVVQKFESDYAFVNVFESNVFENINQLPDGFDELIEITEKVLHR